MGEGWGVIDASALWPQDTAGYLNTASYGLPPEAAVTATVDWVGQWQSGAMLGDWLTALDTSRELLGQLIGIDPARIATGTSVAQLVGLVAASIPDGSLVLTCAGEFTSLVYPFHAQADRGVRVETVPADRLAEVAAQRGDVVAFSLVRSPDGVRVDDAAIMAAVRSRGALAVVDAAQAIGWCDVDYRAYDIVVAPAFKWLCSPRGSAFMLVDPDRLDRIRPSLANWWPSVDELPFYSGSLRLPDTAKRLDATPVWNCWPGTEAALRTLVPIGVPAIGAYVLELAARLRVGLGLPAADSATVLLPDPSASARLTKAGIKTSVTPAGTRMALHIYNTEADVNQALNALT